MRAVVQRVKHAHVDVAGETVGRIDAGLLVYLGAGRGDDDADAAWTANKIAALRVFPDEHGKMSRSVADVGGGVLVVSQFTLYGDVRKGNRPSFDDAAAPEIAERLVNDVCDALRGRGLGVETGRFRATMTVHGEVDGPVTILVDSKKGSG